MMKLTDVLHEGRKRRSSLMIKLTDVLCDVRRCGWRNPDTCRADVDVCRLMWWRCDDKGVDVEDVLRD